MNRAVPLCVLLLILGACQADSSPMSTESAAASSPTTEHLACVDEDGTEIGQIPRPFLHVENETVAAHYASGYRTPCPGQTVEGTVTTLMALDGGTLPGLDGNGDVDVEVATGTPLTVSVSPWNEGITIDFFSWSDLGEPGAGREVGLIDVEPGEWRLDVSPDPGDYVLTLRFHWDYGEDTWAWHFRVLG